jgi:phage terminase small subunit
VNTVTDKQKRFCDEYLIDCNATQAAIRAGYSPKTAYSIGEENLKKPELKTYIDERLEQLRSEKIADAQEVLEYLTSVMRGEHTEQVLRLDGEGVQVVDSIQTPTHDKLKAAELIGKRYGMFKDAVDLGGAVPVVISGGDDLAD